MKASTILSVVLPALALAGPATQPRAADQQPLNLADIILQTLDLASIPLDQIDGLVACLEEHDGYHADFSKADQGIFSMTNVEPTCCVKAKAIWNEMPEGKYGDAVFSEPCEGAVVTGLNKQCMNILRSVFAPGGGK